MKRRYNPTIPIDLIKEEERNTGPLETNKIMVKVVKKSNSINGGVEEEAGVTFKIETDVPLRWLMLRYCLGLSLDFQTTRFEFNAVKLREMDTPQQLGMVHDDVIVAYPVQGGLGYRDVHNVTLCIRMHKERDMFVRVRRYTAILPQLIRCFPNIGPREQGYLHFVYGGLQLDGNHVADALNMEDGDIIDGFNFITMNSSLSVIGPHIILRVKCVSGNETLFRVSQNTRIGKMMDILTPPDAETGRRIRFMFAGRQLSPAKTVEEEQLVDGDIIDSVFCLRGC